MTKKTRKSVAVVAGLTAVLALSPVAGPVATALADEVTPEATTQSVDGIDPQSFSKKDWLWWTGDWHLGNWWWFGGWHPETDFNHTEHCDLCGAWINHDGCKPGCGDDHKPGTGEDEKPEQQMEELIVNFHLADGVTVIPVTIETPVGEQVAFSEFVAELDAQYDGIAWYWTEFDDADQVQPDNLIGGKGDHVINVYEHKSETTDPEQPGGGTEEPDPDPEQPGGGEQGGEEPGTDPEQPGGEEPGTDPENPGSEEPGTDTEDPTDPGTGTEQPGSGSENPAGDGTDTGDGNDGAVTDNTNNGAATDNQATADDANKKDDSAIPNTGDATIAVSGIAAVGAALAGAGVLIRRRR